MTVIFILFILLTFYHPQFQCDDELLPLVINTWGFTQANAEARKVLDNGGSVVDAVEAGCTVCEIDQCDGTVGYGGSPDENGETTLDAMIMDGTTMNAGAVAALRNVKSAVKVARYVMEHTEHTLLVGSQASQFAFDMGFAEESLSTNVSKAMYNKWRENRCQPNFWIDVKPNPTNSCGPYIPIKTKSHVSKKRRLKFHRKHHDTIGMVAVDESRHVAVATSTNGASHKIPGRVGDSPIIGAGAYAEFGIGGAAATGDGDILMRFLPRAIEILRMGLPPRDAAIGALARIMEHYHSFVGAVVVARIDGLYGASCYGMDHFPYSVSFGNNSETIIATVKCLKPIETPLREFGRG